MSISSVMARIGEIQSRFGVSSQISSSTVGIADHAGFDIDSVVELATNTAERVAGAGVAAEIEASLLEALSVGRADAGLAGLGSVVAGRSTRTGTTLSGLVGFDGRATFPVAGYAVGSDFGLRIDPIHGDERMHKGVDIGAPLGTPILAAGGGEVTYAGPRGSYGNLVVVRHDDDTETRYAHQSRVLVAAGDLVARGDVIGEVGSTGKSTGPHLHFETRVDGDAVDPVEWLRAHGVEGLGS